MIQDARFAVVSCNLLDESTGQVAAGPYIVTRAGGEAVVLSGVTERPEARDVQPHLQQQLAGIRVRPPLVGAAEHGRGLADVRLFGAVRAEVSRLEVAPSNKNDSQMQGILKAYRKGR